MKVTVIKQKEDKNINIISSVIMLILGIILVLNANQLITTIFIILGAIITGFGLIKLLSYFKSKQQLNVENNEALISGILSIAIGLITILLASILSNAIQIISGIWLLLLGLNKLTIYLQFKTAPIDLILAIILIGLAIYTIFFENAILIIIGIVLIITAGYDIITELSKNKKTTN